MRRYHVVSGILLVLPIIDFALAAPLLVQEKRQTCVDAVMLNIPKDVITVLAKRGEEEDFEKLVEDYFRSKSKGKQIQTSETHAPSSSAPPGPDHGSTDAVQAPSPGPSSSSESSWASADYIDWDSWANTFRSPADEFGSRYWKSTSLGYLMPKIEPQEGVGMEHWPEPQHGQQPNAGPGPSDPGPSNTKPWNPFDSSTGLGVYRPLSTPTDSERAAMGYRPPPPPVDPDLRLAPPQTSTEADSYRYPGSAMNPPSPGAGSSSTG